VFVTLGYNLLDCGVTPYICHENAACTLVPTQLCGSERQINKCVCNEGFVGDGTYCEGELTAKARPR